MVVCWRIQNEWMVWMSELSQNFAYLPFGSVLFVHVCTAWWRLSGCEFERLRSSPCCTTSWTLSVTEDGFDFLRFLGLGISHIRSDKGDGDFTTVGLGRRRCSEDLIADLSASSLCRRFNCLLGVLPSWLPCLASFGMSLEVLNMIFYVLLLKDLNELTSVNIQLTLSACLCGCSIKYMSCGFFIGGLHDTAIIAPCSICGLKIFFNAYSCSCVCIYTCIMKTFTLKLSE